MPAWAISRLVTFNLTIFIVAIILAVCLYRERKLGVAPVGLVVASIVSIILLICTQEKALFLVTLGCSLLFLHLPLWLSIVTILFWRCHRFVSVLCIILVVTLEVIAYDAFVIEPTALEVTRYEITDARIKQPMRIVVIADLQTDHIGKHERRTLRIALQQNPDLILFAGDYFSVMTIQEWRTIRDHFQKLLEELDFGAPLGVYAVRGNVESWLPWMHAFQGIEGHLVNNRTESFEVGGIHLTCLSEISSFNPHLNLARPDTERFHIVLGHSPDFALGKIDGDLLLAGHTHGGQICFPIFGPLTSGCDVPRSWASGMTMLPDREKADSSTVRRLIVSRGTGMERGPAPRIRFFCRPELVVIDLKPEELAQTLQTSTQNP